MIDEIRAHTEEIIIKGLNLSRVGLIAGFGKLTNEELMISRERVSFRVEFVVEDVYLTLCPTVTGLTVVGDYIFFLALDRVS